MGRPHLSCDEDSSDQLYCTCYIALAKMRMMMMMMIRMMMIMMRIMMMTRRRKRRMTNW